MAIPTRYLLVALIVLVLLSSQAHAFGAGNIASISAIEGKNWRHGDIEDMLKKVSFIRHHKWTSMMVKRVYFGNWLRDYSQAVDVGTLKGCPAETIRVLVWILSFLSFGYATAEFEVTSQRLGVYRPEEHIDNPRDYADNVDARQFDKRLRGPVRPIELEIDPHTGMKNYIANDRGDWSTSLAYVKWSFTRSIQYGRKYCNNSGLLAKGDEADLCEALRCLGQGLHCLEDFGAHSNYVELALRDLGHMHVFPHVGTNTEINLGGKRVFPLVTGTFGGVDFLHSVLGEVTDHVTQSEVNESEIDQMNQLLGNASSSAMQASGVGGTRGFGDAQQEASSFTDLLAKIPGTGDLCQQAIQLQRDSDAQARTNYNQGHEGGSSYNRNRGDDMGYGRDRGFGDDYSRDRGYDEDSGRDRGFDGDYSQNRGPNTSQNQARIGNIPDINQIDVQATVKKIYPILEFRDKVVRFIAGIVSKIPGLESLIDTIQERITVFVMSLLAPFIQPLITAASHQLKLGSTTVVNASGRHQYEPWTDPHCTDPTHSLLSKDHFSNILNEPAGNVASEILQFVAPRVLYAWEHNDVPVEQVMADVAHVFHHPAIRQHNLEIHQKMFNVVAEWSRRQPGGGSHLGSVLSADAVKAGKNHKGGTNPHTHGAATTESKIFGLESQSFVSGGPFAMLSGKRELMGDQYPRGGPPSDAGSPTSYSHHVPSGSNDYSRQSYGPGQDNLNPFGYGSGPVEHQQPQDYQSQDYSSQGYGSQNQGPYSPGRHNAPYPDDGQRPPVQYQSQEYPPQQQYDYGNQGGQYPPEPQGYGGYPPQQGGGGWDQYQQQGPPQGYGNDPYGYGGAPPPQPPYEDPNNPYPQHQQGFGGPSDYQRY